MTYTTIDNPKELPDCTFRCWTTREEVEAYAPEGAEVFVYSPAGTYSYYYVPVVPSAG